MVAAIQNGKPVESLGQLEQKELVRFVVVGSVDDGKSTLIGRLLFESDALPEDQVAAVKRASKQAGLELDLSLFTDGLKAEREQGITIDVAYRYFSTARRKYIIADTPGHQQYTRNMATGASTADAGIILIDARLGILPQSRRHALIASLLGIPQLIVAINKMDLVGFDREVFERLREEFALFARELGFQALTFVPISATRGDNVVQRGAETPWYRGPTVLEQLELIPIGREQANRPLRFPVQLVLRPHLDYRAFAGQLASGRVRVGDTVTVLPSNQRSIVRAIDVFEGELAEARAGQSIAIRLADELDVSRGDMLVGQAEQPTPARELEARLVWLADQPLDPSRELLLKHTTRRVPARVAQVLGKLDLETLHELPAPALEKNDIARVRVTTTRPIFVDAYRDDRSTGAFILIDARSNETVAAGMIDRALDGDELASEATPVTPDERRRHLGHGGALVRVESLESPIAHAVERALLERGVTTLRIADAATAKLLSGSGLVILTAAGSAADVDARTSTRVREVLQALEDAKVLDAEG